MQTLIRMLDDVYPHGCLGDVVGVDEAGLKNLKAVAKVRKHEVYELLNGATQEADNTEAAAQAKADAEAKAEEARAAKQAKEEQKAKEAADKKAADEAAAQAKADADK